MGRLQRLFTEHPAAVGETYGQHMTAALRVGAKMIYGGIGAFIHAFLPFLCVRTGSTTINSLHAQISQRLAPAEQEHPALTALNTILADKDRESLTQPTNPAKSA